MRGGRKHRCDKRLFHFRHPVTIELQEFFIPNSPSPVKIRIAIVIRVLIIFGTTKIFLKPTERAKARKPIEPFIAPWKKQMNIPCFWSTHQQCWIHHSKPKESKERFYKAWYRRQYRRHPINTLAAIAI